MANDLTLEIDALNKPYWEAIEQGRLTYQSCTDCGHNWHTARAQCPVCLSANLAWKTASGDGRIISWVVYHVAYHPAFEHRLPYNVALVELAEGPRLLSNVLCDAARLHAYAPVRLLIDTSADVPLPCFEMKQ